MMSSYLQMLMFKSDHCDCVFREFKEVTFPQNNRNYQQISSGRKEKKPKGHWWFCGIHRSSMPSFFYGVYYNNI